jgi:uncharacterized protein (TIGR02145 family)
MKSPIPIVFVIIPSVIACKKSDPAGETPTSSKNTLDTMMDIDRNVYRTVKIGKQVWMAQNLRVSRYNNGDSIKYIVNDTTWKAVTQGAWCFYGNAQFLDPAYGKLYNWYAINDPRGIAPKGWRIPTISDWQQLVDSVGGLDSAGANLKEVSLFWQQANPATNKSGFSARPGGIRGVTSTIGYSENINRLGWYWSSSPANQYIVMCILLFHYNTTVSFGGAPINAGLSIRCIKN